ncbi:MAG: hypothetical protein LBM73_02775 [Candidatus Nomurabacteria bacterium]|nr:hypothetical protein [Candidatus Nomurabacteria bacterium]
MSEQNYKTYSAVIWILVVAIFLLCGLALKGFGWAWIIVLVGVAAQLLLSTHKKVKAAAVKTQTKTVRKAPVKKPAAKKSSARRK